MPRFRANPHLPPFPVRAFHALLPLCPSMESPSPTCSASKKDIIRKSVTSSHHPAIFRCRGRGTGQFHTRSKRPATLRGIAWWIGQVKGKASKLHYICGPSCTGAADNPFELREHPGYRLRIAGQNSESVEAEEDTSWGSLKMRVSTIETFFVPAWYKKSFNSTKLIHSWCATRGTQYKFWLIFGCEKRTVCFKLYTTKTKKHTNGSVSYKNVYCHWQWYETNPHHTNTVLKKSVSSTMWASFKCVFVSEHLSFVSYHHADFSYPWHLFHTQMSFFHTLCNIFIPFWYN